MLGPFEVPANRSMRAKDNFHQLHFHLGMGWLALIAVRPLWLHMPASGITWLAAGGVAYGRCCILRVRAGTLCAPRLAPVRDYGDSLSLRCSEELRRLTSRRGQPQSHPAQHGYHISCGCFRWLCRELETCFLLSLRILASPALLALLERSGLALLFLLSREIRGSLGSGRFGLLYSCLFSAEAWWAQKKLCVFRFCSENKTVHSGIRLLSTSMPFSCK
jgi:hypothetical protein